METLRNEVFTPDAVWHVPGTGYFAGPKEGVEAILQFFAEIFERSGGTLQAILDDVVAGDDHTISLNRNVAMRNNLSLNQKAVLVFDMVDGRISRVDQYFDDTTYNDEFWA
jgi:ketosteroid isomerase-like protein